MNGKAQEGMQSNTANKGWQKTLSFVSQNQSIEPLIRLTKIHHQHCLDLSRAEIECLYKICEVGWSGDVNRIWETYMEAHKELFKTIEGSLKQQAVARFDLWRCFVPGQGSPDDAKSER
ncbi:MAG: hypothetical protein CSYNP_04056 [Syntrophus sp. SKADARSKE-3]|nr:hypothetical protein [Syntrophus sp. SKADARSKE-3]